MSLFNAIPAHFFSILSSPNRDVYADALLVLFNSLESDELSIKKNDYIRALKDKANNELLKFDLSLEEPDETDEDDFSDSSSNEGKLQLETMALKAAFIVRRLEETGWIDIEIDPESFDEYIALPAYSIQFLSLLNTIANASEAPYTSLVHATYSELKMEDGEPDEFMYATLIRAYENTKRLRTELVTLGHSIRIFQNRLGKVFTTNGILHDYFDTYKETISDRYYHPLKTFDSVAKYRRPIINMLQRWLHDEDIRSQLIAQALVYGPRGNKNQIETDIIAKINYVCDMYDTLNNMIDSIDERHQDYTRSSANKILYLNNNDKTIKGHLDTIFRSYAKSAITGEGLANILSKMQDAIPLESQSYVDNDSLTLPYARQSRLFGEPMAVPDFLDVDSMLMSDFLAQTRNEFTDDRVFDFMETAFGEADEISIEEIPLPNFDAFILLILASIKASDEKCFYAIEAREGQIVSYGYSLPRFIYKRKELIA